MYSFSPFRLDLKNQCLWRGGEQIAMAPKAFGILAFLVERAGELVLQTELLDALWPEVYVQPEVLKSHIREIRTKLGDDAKAPRYIATLSRRGYRFIAPVKRIYEGGAQREAETGPYVPAGQEKSLPHLREYWAKALSGERQIVFVSGEAGAGKTTLVNSFLRQVTGDGREVLCAQGQCVEGCGTQEPYYPVLAGILQLTRSRGRELVVETLAGHAPTWLVQFPALVTPAQREALHREIIGATRQRMLRELCEALEVIAQDRPLLIVLEDVHWADFHTIEWLVALAHGQWPARIMVVTTLRPVDLALSQSPLRRLKDVLSVRRLCHEVKVRMLTEAEIARMVEEKGASEDIARLLAVTLFRHSEGNPLFMNAALEHLLASGLVAVDGDHWKVNSSLAGIELAVPETLGQVIAAQIETQLSDPEKRLLEAASVCGIAFATAAAASALDQEVEEIENTLAGLARLENFVRPAGMVELPDGTRSSTYEFVHSFYRQCFYTRLGYTRRANLHKKIGEYLERSYQGELKKVASQIGHHFENCGEWERAIGYLFLVAETDAERLAYRDAASVLEHARSLAEKTHSAEEPELELRIIHRLATSYLLADDTVPAVRNLKLLIESAKRCGDKKLHAWALIKLGMILIRLGGDAGNSAAQEALSVARQLDDERFAEGIQRSVSLLRIMSRGWSEADAAQVLAEPSDGSRLLENGPPAQEMAAEALVLFLSSRYAEGLRLCEAALPVLAKMRDPESDRTQVVQAWNLSFLGRFGEAMDLAQARLRAAHRDESRGAELNWKLQQAWIYLWLLQPERTLEIAKELGGVIEEPLNAAFRKQHRMLLGSAEVQLGLFDEARAHLTESAGEDQRFVSLGWYWEIPTHLASIDLWLGVGSIAKAREEAEVSISRCANCEEQTWQALAWEAGARVAIREGDLAGATSSIRTALEIVGSALLPLAEWRVHLTAADLLPKEGQRHQRAAAKTTGAFAESLRKHEDVRQSFLAAREAAVCAPRPRQRQDFAHGEEPRVYTSRG